ncbi:MAG: hypothetical protein A3G93_08205 [Nitrospinae bacterium RIFCSPLOWO2_12_FULL_45_22]|nr:MAG: hypothetical protein A3G93_08205 [Nitrospinae bacterium RIFCSPLOWO2_12_FULL_45_22]
MSIPFVWQEVRWKPEWGWHRGKDISGHEIVDGGVLSNFPLHLITAKDDEEVRAIMGDTDPDVVPNLGLLIDEMKPVADSGEAEEAKGTEKVTGGLLENVMRLKTIQRIKRLANTMTNAHDKPVMEGHKEEVCRLPAKGYGTTEFDMSDVRLQSLIRAGRKAMQEYLDARPL